MNDLYFINTIDERNNFLRFQAYDNGRVGQDDSHTYSYLGARKQLQSTGKVMGLDKIILSES